ncbi:MAG TPA: chloride channel protein [Thermoanaerobaculia bacterium]|nr:chloride channel protein [Thermoanaerobaculia bacterium]
MHAQTPSRRLILLSLLAAGLGVLGGGAAWVLLHLISLLTNLALFHRVGWDLPSFTGLRPSGWIVVAAMAGAFLVSLLAKWAPVIRGHGIPETMEAVLVRQSRISPRAAVAKPLSAALAIGTGGPFGAEGPIIVTGGALGSLIGQVLHVSPSERKILLACGAAAGMSATFGAPLASVVLAIELLLFEFSTRAFVPLVVAASVAAGLHSALFGSGPLFSVPVHDYAGLKILPWFVVLGVACGLLAVVVSKGLFWIEDGFRRLPIHDFWHPVIGALGFSAVGLLVPRALGVGYDAIGDVLNDRLAVTAIAVLAIAKLVAWWIALGSGTSGGTLAPLLLIGGAFGSLVGSLAAALSPGLGLSPGAFAVVGMAALFGASTRATFTSIVFLFELTRDYQIILPLMLAAVVADVIAAALMHESLMTEKLARRGLRVQTEYEVDVLRTTLVRDVMTREVETLSAALTVGEARARLLAGRHSAYPLVDGEGKCVGILSRGDFLRQAPDDAAPVAGIASGDVIAVAPGDTVFRALQLILEEGVEHLPVLEDGRLAGICTRTDVLRARRRQFDLERRQPGWSFGSGEARAEEI